jgi:hypothetical protein
MSCVVHEHVDPAVMGFDRRDHVTNILLLRHVRGHCERVRKGGRKRSDLVGRTRHQRNLRAFPLQQFRRRFPDAAGSSGDGPPFPLRSLAIPFLRAFLQPLPPCMAALRTVRPVHAQQSAAFRARPFPVFVLGEPPDAVLLYAHKVLDHAHAVPGPIAEVHSLQAAAGKPFAIEAISVAAPALFAVLDRAKGPGLRLAGIVSSAAGTWIFLPLERVAEAAVHAAGRVQCCRPPARSRSHEPSDSSSRSAE